MKITLGIEWPDDVDVVSSIQGADISLSADGFSQEEISIPILLAAIEEIKRVDLEAHLGKAHPHQGEEIISAMAALNARLSIVDTLMHLPMTS